MENKKSNILWTGLAAVLYASSFGIMGVIRDKASEVSPSGIVTLVSSNVARLIEDVDGDGIPDRTQTVIYGPSFGVDLGYRSCSDGEVKYFMKKWRQKNER